jgi:hypothetical protein
MTDQDRITKHDVFLAILSWVDPALAPNGMRVSGDKLTVTHVEAALADLIKNPERRKMVASYCENSTSPGYFAVVRDALARLYPSLKNVDTHSPIVDLNLVELDNTSHAVAPSVVVGIDSTDPDVKREAVCDLVLDAYRDAHPATVAADIGALAERLLLKADDVFPPRAVVVGYYGGEEFGEHVATACETLGIKKGDQVEFLIRKATP